MSSDMPLLKVHTNSPCIVVNHQHMPKTGQQTTDDDEYGQECVVATNNQLRNNYECLYSIIYKLPAPHASYTLAHLHTIPPASSTSPA
jgi:hypothetical protein